MGSSTQSDSNDAEGEAPLETDPSNRFQRLNEILGEGAYKTVYRAFDQEEGVEVAWNQLRIDHLTKREAQNILSEIEILQSIRNDHIINFYASWSTKAPNGGERIVFITELMSSGTLKQYLKKTLKGALKPKVIKSWCRQILQGLVYLHTHNPPIIHRDLKCDNIFINGNNGQLKIGDLGLAVVRHRTHVSSVLGTPEFMAPELYDEKYDEKVDIYAFGMCVLEMASINKLFDVNLFWTSAVDKLPLATASHTSTAGHILRTVDQMTHSQYFSLHIPPSDSNARKTNRLFTLFI
ncbi:Serine/threonine-protein kinase wnk4 [Linnemannia zychae]|nr:Serine/threonine-protein kinase wnk4 [Linnemannia zychae]